MSESVSKRTYVESERDRLGLSKIISPGFDKVRDLFQRPAGDFAKMSYSDLCEQCMMAIRYGLFIRGELGSAKATKQALDKRFSRKINAVSSSYRKHADSIHERQGLAIADNKELLQLQYRIEEIEATIELCQSVLWGIEPLIERLESMAKSREEKHGRVES